MSLPKNENPFARGATESNLVVRSQEILCYWEYLKTHIHLVWLLAGQHCLKGPDKCNVQTQKSITLYFTSVFNGVREWLCQVLVYLFIKAILTPVTKI